jgi:hypothetical protein
MSWIGAVLKDLRFAGRIAWRRPLFTVTAILIAAFGVGANTAIDSVLETVLFNPLGIRDAGKVMVASVHIDEINMHHSSTSANVAGLPLTRGAQRRRRRDSDETTFGPFGPNVLRKPFVSEKLWANLAQSVAGATE